MKYRATIILSINTFEADNQKDAEQKMHSYIDKIAQVTDAEIICEKYDFDIFDTNNLAVNKAKQIESYQ